MSTTLKKTFVNFINEGATAASLISESDKKAMAYAALANAIAQSGLLSDTTTTIPDVEEKKAEEPAKETKEKEAPKGKDSIKKGAGKTSSRSKKKKTEQTEPAVTEADVPAEAPAPVEETAPVQEDVQAPVQEAEPVAPTAEPVDAEIVDEWTDEANAEKQESLETLQWYIENWTEEYVESCVKAWFEDDSVTLADIRPSNIDGFLLYLYELAQQGSEEQ